MNIVVLGAAESGVGAARLAQAKGFEVLVSDKGQIAPAFRQELEAYGIRYEEGRHSMDKILAADEIIKSPGIPEKAPVIQAARQKGIRVSSEIDFASRFTDARLIAITGTNGKTTTTLLTYHLLRTAGLHVGLAGNVGESFARKVATASYDYYVLEVSSFQLDDIHGFHPYIAMILNITPDHLDRYDSMQDYILSKFKITQNMGSGDLFIYNADDENVAREFNRRKFLAQTEPFTLGFWRNDELHVPVPSYYHPGLEDVVLPRQAIFNQFALRGRHNAMNMSAAILAALRLNIPREVIAEGLRTFKNAEHRLEEVAVFNGITFINDSKATNVDSCVYALDSFKNPIIWIVGGKDKGNDYTMVADLVRRNVKAIICLGVDNSKIVKFFGEMVGFIHETQKVEEAVEKAYHVAEKGDIVLLSPACASFDLFQNYEDRGRRFKQAVHAFIERQQHP